MFGHFDEEMRAKMSATRKGKPCSEVTRTKISTSLTGLHYSDERRRRMSESWTPERRAAQAERIVRNMEKRRKQ